MLIFVKSSLKLLKNYGIIIGSLSNSVAFVCLTGCSSKLKESTFECFDNEGNKDSVTLTYEKDSSGQKVFYDGEQKIGYRSSAIDYASEKTGGMTCHAGTDR